MANLDYVGRWPAQAPPQVLVLKGITKMRESLLTLGLLTKTYGKRVEGRHLE